MNTLEVTCDVLPSQELAEWCQHEGAWHDHRRCLNLHTTLGITLEQKEQAESEDMASCSLATLWRNCLFLPQWLKNISS